MLLNKPISILYFLNTIKYQVLIIGVFAFTVGFLDDYNIFEDVAVPVAVPAFVGTAVSLLLAFRTAQSYERWWEARKVWGAIVNDSRTLVREVLLFLPAGQEKAIQEWTRRQITWSYALGESLRRLPFSDKVSLYLNENQVKGSNIPNALLDKHNEQLRQWARDGLITEINQMQLNETLVRLCESMGKCERIKNTVFPRSYSVLLHTIIYAFAVMLPFSLDDRYIVTEILLTILIPLMFITIEKTAILMQDPFENTPLDTPMTALAQTIEINLLQMTGDPNVPGKQDATTYYLL